MAQQTLIGEDYGLLSGEGDREQAPGWMQNVTARPNFYATLLHRQLCGSTVLSSQTNAIAEEITASKTDKASDGSIANESRVSAHSFCTADSAGMPAGAVTVVLINFATDAVAVDMGASGFSGDLNVFGLYGLPAASARTSTPSDPALLALITSRRTYLNGAPDPLTIDSVLAPSVIPGHGKSGTVQMPALGVAYIVVPHANAPACI